MMRHIGNPRLGATALGNVDDGHQHAVAAVVIDLASVGQDLDLASIGFAVAAVAVKQIAIGQPRQCIVDRAPLARRPQIPHVHAQEIRAAVTIMPEHRIVDVEDLRSLPVEDAHRHRIGVEQQPERGLTPFERGHVGNGHRDDVTERMDAKPEIAVVAVELELVTSTMRHDLEQPRHHVRAAQHMAALLQAVPLQVARRQPEQLGRRAIVMHNLEIARRTGAVADGRKRDHPVVRRREDRIEQIILRGALVDIGPHQRAAPARAGRQRQHIIGANHAIAHAMRRRRMRLPARQRGARRLRQHRGAIRRPGCDGDVPSLVLQPMLDITAAARDLQHATVILQHRDVIGETTEAAEHHVLIARQCLARLQRRLPFALEHRDIVEEIVADLF